MNYFLLGLSIILSRVIPHPPGMTPLFAITLLLGAQTNKRLACSVLIASLVTSDLLASLIYHTQAFGDWTIFVYTGFLSNYMLGNFLGRDKSAYKTGTISISGCLLFWLWSNFGVWLTSCVYQYSFRGLFDAYILALPFLTDTIIPTFGCLIITQKACVFKRNNLHKYVSNIELKTCEK